MPENTNNDQSQRTEHRRYIQGASNINHKQEKKESIPHELSSQLTLAYEQQWWQPILLTLASASLLLVHNGASLLPPTE
jgi:hypothetical protein